MKTLKILVFKKSIINSFKCTCIFAISNLSIAQSSYLNLDVENDLYFLTDEYYSSGIFIEVGKVVEKDSIKKFKIWELGQEIYTPSETDSKDFQNYDYPFGGWTLSSWRSGCLSWLQQWLICFARNGKSSSSAVPSLGWVACRRAV